MARGSVTWEWFQTVFYEQYFPESFHDELEVEFTIIEQGIATIAEYVACFTQLYCFSQLISEEKKVKKLIRGFKPSI